MRVTGNHLIELSAAATSRQQNKLASVADQVSSGVRVQAPSDDPVAWLSAQRAKLQRTLTDGASTAVQATRDRLDDADASLAEIGEAAAQIRTLAIQANAPGLTAVERAGIAAQVRGLQVVALGAANRRDPNGEYLLAGSNALTEPFDATGTYQGDAIARSVPDGQSHFPEAMIPGSTLTAANGVDVLPLFGRVADALAANDLTTLEATLPDLATAIGQIASTRTRAGSNMVVLDETLRAHSTLADALTTTIARSLEVDSIGAASELAKTSQALEVSRAVSAHVISLLSPST